MAGQPLQVKDSLFLQTSKSLFHQQGEIPMMIYSDHGITQIVKGRVSGYLKGFSG
jgi:hypothetical protein